MLLLLLLLAVFSVECQTFQHFNPCGALIKDLFQVEDKTLFLQQDLHTQIIEAFSSQNHVSVMIQTNTTTEMWPGIFPSMNYKCFLHIHISFKHELFQARLSYESGSIVSVTFFARATYIIIFQRPLKELNTLTHKKLLRVRRVRIFATHLTTTPVHNSSPILIHLKNWFFYCAFCLFPLKSIQYTKYIQNFDNNLFQRFWHDSTHTHYSEILKESVKNYVNQLGGSFPCKSRKLADFLDSESGCEVYSIELDTILDATKLNITLSYRSGSPKLVSGTLINYKCCLLNSAFFYVS